MWKCADLPAGRCDNAFASEQLIARWFHGRQAYESIRVRRKDDE